MSIVTYDAGQMLLTVDDTGVERALGSLYRKTPAVLKVAINRTARQARKDLISEAEKRYALTVRGKARLRLLKLRKSATNTSLSAELRQGDEGLTLNASYFQHSPTVPRMGLAVLHGPAYQRVRTLQGGPMEELTETGSESKGFLIRVSNAKSDHLMFKHDARTTRVWARLRSAYYDNANLFSVVGSGAGGGVSNHSAGSSGGVFAGFST